jgi:DNA-directed RNA polymerase sigma subunit (sigma70/sigma32)
MLTSPVFHLFSSDPSPDEYIERSILRQCIENAFASELAPHERDVLRLRHGLDDGVARSAKDVSDVFGGTISEGQVRTAESSAYRKLRGQRGQSIHTRRLLGFEHLAGFATDETGT